MTTVRARDGREESLNRWLETAVQGLCDVASARIVSEITEHVADATAQGVCDGLQLREARERAVQDLGDPNRAREIFVREHLTRREAAIISRQRILRPRPIMRHVGIRLVLFPLAFWLLAILCLAEYATLTGRVGGLSGREAFFIAPWVLWLAYCVLMLMRGDDGQPITTKRELRHKILGFYALMWSSSVALLASTDGRILMVGALWLLLVIAFSFSRLPLAAKLHRVNAREVEAYCCGPGLDM
jgi:hypothetical protein